MYLKSLSSSNNSVIKSKGKNYKTALKAFSQEIRETRGLLEALQAIGYRGNERILTPRMVQVIEEFLGEA